MLVGSGWTVLFATVSQKSSDVVDEATVVVSVPQVQLHVQGVVSVLVVVVLLVVLVVLVVVVETGQGYAAFIFWISRSLKTTFPNDSPGGSDTRLSPPVMLKLKSRFDYD